MVTLFRHVHGPTTIRSSCVLPTDDCNAESAQVLYTQLLQKLTSMKSKALANVQEQQRRYRRQFDTKVRSPPGFERERLVHVNKPPLSTAAYERQKPEENKNLISR